MVGWLRPLVVASLVATACGIDPGAIGQRPTEQPTPTNAVAMKASGDACPLTIPADEFVPPKPYPPKAPDLYQAVWHGTPALWTMLGPHGEVWTDLPKHDELLTQKTLWWSDDYSWTEEPTPPITVTGRRLDGPGSFEAGGPGTNGSREDIGSFMLVGIELPAAGCWELTARYGDASLSYVAFVED